MGFGQSPMSSALYLASLGASFGVTSLFAGRFARGDVRRALMTGAVVDLAGMLLALAVCWLSTSFEPIDLVPSLLIVGVGYGFFMTPILNAVLILLSRKTTSSVGSFRLERREGDLL
jgi:hypothetical protein